MFFIYPEKAMSSGRNPGRCIGDYIFNSRKKQLKSGQRRRIFNFTALKKLCNMTSMKYGTKAIKQSTLELWPNPNPERDYIIDISYPEFTCLCPRSGYPDFATIRITYTPDKKVVELKALKLYLNSFRDQSISHEAVTNLIFNTLKQNLMPRSLEVVGDFNVRGNVKTVIRVAL
jgi:7-cyano-7-deazaguanine reductase